MATRPAPKHLRIRWADNSPVDSDDARGRIVAAAVECVNKFGPAKTTMDDVAKVAAITRPTVYKYFPSRNELLIAVFLREIDDSLDKGLNDFFSDAETVDDLREGVAQSMAYILGRMRSNETTRAILLDSRIPVEELLTGAAALLVGVMENAVETTLTSAIDPKLLSALRPISPEGVAHWIIRTVYAFYVWPEPERELTFFRDYLAPVFVRDVD